MGGKQSMGSVDKRRDSKSGPRFKLKNFNRRGRAEACHLVFALADQPYQDVRVNFESLKDVKPKTRFELLPLLEFDGKTYSQTLDILVTLGTEFGFYPSDPDEAFKVDDVIYIMEDYFNEAIRADYVDDPEEREQKLEEFNNLHVPSFNAKLEKLLSENSESPDFFVGDKMTVADMAVFDYMSTRGPEDLLDFPLLQTFVDSMNNMEKIKAWVDNRPKTDS